MYIELFVWFRCVLRQENQLKAILYMTFSELRSFGHFGRFWWKMGILPTFWIFTTEKWKAPWKHFWLFCDVISFFNTFVMKKVFSLHLCSEIILKGEHPDFRSPCTCLNSGIIVIKLYFLFPRESMEGERSSWIVQIKSYCNII